MSRTWFIQEDLPTEGQLDEGIREEEDKMEGGWRTEREEVQIYWQN